MESKHYPDRPARAPSRDSMRSMVRRKLDRPPTVEDFKRALRHAAHAYHTTPDVNVLGKASAAERLYEAARALKVAEDLLGAVL